jgi:hypothetical protein
MCWRPLSRARHQSSFTFNLRHFRREHLEPWGIHALHPQSFLIEIFSQEQSAVMTKLEQQAADRSRSLCQLLDILSNTVPDFVAIVSATASRK